MFVQNKKFAIARSDDGNRKTAIYGRLCGVEGHGQAHLWTFSHLVLLKVGSGEVSSEALRVDLCLVRAEILQVGEYQ